MNQTLWTIDSVVAMYLIADDSMNVWEYYRQDDAGELAVNTDSEIEPSVITRRVKYTGPDWEYFAKPMYERKGVTVSIGRE